MQLWAHTMYFELEKEAYETPYELNLSIFLKTSPLKDLWVAHSIFMALSIEHESHLDPADRCDCPPGTGVH